MFTSSIATHYTATWIHLNSIKSYYVIVATNVSVLGVTLISKLIFALLQWETFHVISTTLIAQSETIR